MIELDLKYKGVIFEGATFPDAPYKIVPVKLTTAISSIYIPAREKAIPKETLGMKLLVTIHALQEGFYEKSRSFKSNNPGNIGNDDSGKTKVYATLEEGITVQCNYIKQVAENKHPRYQMGKEMTIKPFYSKEIDNHPEYGLPANLPGYHFVFTGQLDQYVKIYATGARAGNGYINRIVSFFKQNGLDITPTSKIQDIIKLN